MSRTKKKPYSKRAQQVSKRCRCHGGCSYCLDNRMHKHDKKINKSNNELKDEL